MKILELINPDIANLHPYEPGRPIEEVARELGLDPEGIIKLASNESALGPSPKALAAMQRAVAEMHLYPDGGAYSLRSALAEHYRLERAQVVMGNGSNEVLELVGHAFFAPGRSVVVSAYSFIIYRLVAWTFGAEIIEVPMKPGLVHDLEAMAAAVREDTVAVFICNPNNPTGSSVTAEEIHSFMKQVDDSTLVVFDEAYLEIGLASEVDNLRYIRESHACLITRTFSKAYGLAGLRVGYGLGPAPIIEAMQKAREPFNCNRMAQIAALAALEDEEFLAQGREIYRQGKASLEAAFEEMGLEYIPTSANFILVKVGAGAELFEALKRKGVIVRPMGGYGLPEWVRVTLGLPEENTRFLKNLKAQLER